jgi:hypothetical protein
MVKVLVSTSALASWVAISVAEFQPTIDMGGAGRLLKQLTLDDMAARVSITSGTFGESGCWYSDARAGNSMDTHSSTTH